MSAPSPLTTPDLNIRTHSAYDLEVVLVKFFERLVNGLRLDNPTLNLAQPDVIPYDYDERAQTVALKVKPRIERGRVPRTVTGEIDLDRLPDCPAIIVQVVDARVEIQETVLTVRILFSAYDEDPASRGYQDVLNMMEAAAIALTSFGQKGLDDAYPIVMPIDWKLLEANTFPHYCGEMTTKWQLPSARPLPDADECFIPAEHIEFRASAERELVELEQ